MAYVSQELKAKLAPNIKAVLKKYGVKASIAVRNHSTLVINIREGSLDLIGNYNEEKQHNLGRRIPGAREYVDVNPYWYHEQFTGRCLEFISSLFAAAKGTTWYDRSDAMTDYFDTAYYIDINVGNWQKPYKLVK